MQLTKNFKSEEFGKNLTPYQEKLIDILAVELQRVRNYINSEACSDFKVNKKKDIGMVITSGVRTKEDYDSLVARGYNPSKTSDHFCGYSLTGNPTLGAADVILTNFNGDYKGLFNKLVWKCGNEFHFGQLILEYNPANKRYWFHFGNDPERIYGFLTDKVITRKKFLISNDNGKTYQEFKL